MMTEQRQEKILNYLKEHERASVEELRALLDTSESTLRRDLVSLEEQGLARRVRGGVSIKKLTVSTDSLMSSRRNEYQKEKMQIARTASTLVQDGDLIYLDAGTTVEALIPLLASKKIRAVTNSLSHAVRLSELGIPVSLTGGELKTITNALIGEEALAFLEKYHFSKGFFGTNAIMENGELLTPDVREAAVKKKAMDHSVEKYVLADSSKFSRTSSIRFGNLSTAALICEDDASIPGDFPILRLQNTDSSSEQTEDDSASASQQSTLKTGRSN